MTAYEMIDGQYYAQGSDEYYEALETTTAKEYPTVKTERVLVRQFWSAKEVVERAVVLSGLNR